MEKSQPDSHAFMNACVVHSYVLHMCTTSVVHMIMKFHTHARRMAKPLACPQANTGGLAFIFRPNQTHQKNSHA